MFPHIDKIRRSAGSFVGSESRTVGLIENDGNKRQQDQDNKDGQGFPHHGIRF
jgi:hypothetical protein